VGDALTFLDPVFSTGMYLTLVSGELAADAVIEGLKKGDVSGRQFEGYGETVCGRIETLRRLVYAFYAEQFSFKDLIMKYPNLKSAVTDCLQRLIGIPGFAGSHQTWTGKNLIGERPETD
jgi:flavin-dependent dehydrogenase